jgi:hypothetical protein
MANPAKLYDQQTQQSLFNKNAGLANIFTPKGGVGKYTYVNVAREYPWTLSENARSNAPTVILREFQVNETTIRRQAQFYITGAQNFFNASNNILSPYENLYPKDRPTGFVYEMPYFSEVNFEVNTPMWTSLDTLEQLSKAVVGGVGLLAGQTAAGIAETAVGVVGGATMAGLALGYPKVGITDRPRLWDSHEPRSINIKFPLFNTVGADDWKTNRELCELLVNQNLYNKRDLITSIPPVFYEVLVVGQHYSYASCVTQLTIYNRGNMRLLRDDNNQPVNVPDVYEVDMTVTDMVMPSKNQFQSIKDKNVVSELVNPNRGFVGGPTDTGARDAFNTASKAVDTLLNRANLEIQKAL